MASSNRIYFLTVLETKCPQSRCWQGFFWRLEERILFCVCLVSGGCWKASALLGSEACHSKPCLRLCVPFLSVSLCYTRPSYKDTSHWIKSSPESSMISSSLIISAKTFVPSKVTFWGSGWPWILGRCCSTQDTWEYCMYSISQRLGRKQFCRFAIWHLQEEASKDIKKRWFKIPLEEIKKY